MRSAMSTYKASTPSFSIGDQISYAFGSGMAYGEVVRLLDGGDAVEVQLEDGRKEIKRSRDRSLRLLRRATGQSEVEESHSDRSVARDREIDEVRRSDVRRRS